MSVRTANAGRRGRSQRGPWPPGSAPDAGRGAGGSGERGESSVDGEGLSGGVAGFVGAGRWRRGRYPSRCLGGRGGRGSVAVGSCLGGEASQRGVDQARHDHVDAHAAWGGFLTDVTADAVQRGLGGPVGGMSEVVGFIAAVEEVRTIDPPGGISGSARACKPGSVRGRWRQRRGPSPRRSCAQSPTHRPRWCSSPGRRGRRVRWPRRARPLGGRRAAPGRDRFPPAGPLGRSSAGRHRRPGRTGPPALLTSELLWGQTPSTARAALP